MEGSGRLADPKRLTVSYGSFTCTVEGFDEPFQVMRLVVDYFQGLTQADPGFGAQPKRIDPVEVTRRASMASGTDDIHVAVDPGSEGDAVTIRKASAVNGADVAAPNGRLLPVLRGGRRQAAATTPWT